MRRTLGILGLVAIAGIATAVPGSRQAPAPAGQPAVAASGQLAGIGTNITVMADDPALLRQRELERNLAVTRAPVAAPQTPNRRVIELDPVPPEKVVNPTKNFLFTDLTNRSEPDAAPAGGLDAAARRAQVERIRQAALAKQAAP